MKRLTALFASTSLALAIVSCGGGETTTTTGTSTESTTTGEPGGSAGASGTAGTGGTAGSSMTGSGGAAGDTTTSVDKAAPCTDTFGSALTSSFGRLDGTVLAVVKPTDVQCPMPNSDHVILEVVMNGDAYRMVVNVKSNNAADPDVWYLAADHTLPPPVWEEGWHTGLTLDYVKDLGVHAGDFAQHPMAEVSDMIADEITLGQKVSVYAQSSGGASAHNIHRYNGLVDGAILLDPDSAKSRMLLFHFTEQSF